MRSAYSIDGQVQIDFGPDALVQMWRFGIDHAKTRHLFITHSHDDHFLPLNLLFRQPGFAKLPEGNVLRLYGNDMVRHVTDQSHVTRSLAQIEFELIEPFRPVQAGDLRVTPVLADHGGDEIAVTYLAESASGSILQANDTGWFPDATWEYLKGRRIDAVLLDCTYGRTSCRESHLGGPEVIETRAEMLSRGALADDGRVIVTHLSHSGGLLHRELCEYFAPHAIEVAYDGMVIEV
ncbi:MAG: MBL fold metallo-hydrolase [Armatimonadota bacterium]